MPNREQRRRVRHRVRPVRSEYQAYIDRATRHLPPLVDEPMPILPGIVPDLTEESMQRAMDQAHQDLPQIPGTGVELLVFNIDDGLEHLREVGYDYDQLALVRERAAAIAGDDPHMVIATRQPR